MSQSPSAQSIRNAIADFPDPETGRGLESMGQILDVQLDGNDARITIAWQLIPCRLLTM